MQKLQARKLVFKDMIFHVQHALKLTYEHLRFQKFSGGYTPGPPFQGEPRLTRREGERITRVKGRGGEGRVPPNIPSRLTPLETLVGIS
jgi:hypothetical protein